MTSRVDNIVNEKGAVVRWVVSIGMLVALIAVTTATLHWYQPIRALFEDYLGIEVATDAVFESESESRLEQEIYALTEQLNIEEPVQLRRGNQNSVFTPDPIVGGDAETAISTSVENELATRASHDSARIELQFALVSITNELDLPLATDALRRAGSIASTNHMSLSFIRLVEQARTEIDQLSTLNLDSIRDRLDTLSKAVVSIESKRSEGTSVNVPDTSMNVSTEPEAQSFWNGLSDGIADVYRVRRINESTSAPETFLVETGAQLRLLVMLERARSDIRLFDFDAYRATLGEAIAWIDSLSQEDAKGLTSIRVELLDLVSLELVSPHKSIRAALGELTNEATLHAVDSTALDL